MNKKLVWLGIAGIAIFIAYQIFSKPVASVSVTEVSGGTAGGVGS
jgi:hypothetical protein